MRARYGATRRSLREGGRGSRVRGFAGSRFAGSRVAGRGSRVAGSRFAGSRFAGSRVRSSRVRGFAIRGFAGSRFAGSRVRGFAIRGFAARGSRVRGSRVRGSRVRGSRVRGSRVRGSRFAGSRFAGSRFGGPWSGIRDPGSDWKLATGNGLEAGSWKLELTRITLMRVLVTGGTGYLGAAIVRSLVRQGHEPVVFARHAAQSALPGRLVDGDVRDRRALRRAADDAEAIIHSAALVSLWQSNPSAFDEINVGGLEAMLDVAKSRGTVRIVYTSSFLALPPAGHSAALSANDYQRTKAKALTVARAAAAAGQPLITLIPGVIYGPGAATEGNLIGRLVMDHRSGRLPGLVGADRCWSYAHVDDVADAHVTALSRTLPRQEYVLGGINAPQMRLFEIIRDLTGAALPRRIPFALASMIGWFEEQKARISGRPPLITRGAVEIFRYDWTLNSLRSIDELSYRILPLETGLRSLISP
jgi:nucleoside-diphosphate-sugar epimerase